MKTGLVGFTVSKLRFHKPAWVSRLRHPYPEQFSPRLDFPPYAGTPRLYLMATTPRCGSHFLGHTLHATGQFGFPLEYLNRMNLDIWRARLKAEDDVTALKALLRIRTSPSGWFGLKAHWKQFSAFKDKAFFDEIGGFEKMIWIYRRNLLGQSISRCIAEQTGQWISGATRRGTPVYDYEAIVRNAKLIRNQNLKWQAFFANVPERRLLAIVYEDLLSDQPNQLATVGQFLDADLNASPKTPEKTRKQSGQTSIDWAEKFAAEVSDSHTWILEPQKF